MLFSIRNSSLGFILILERPLEGFHFISPHSCLGPSHLLQLQCYLCLIITLCCRVLQWRFQNTISWLALQRRETYVLWEISKEGFKAYFIFWHLANTFYSTYNVVSLSDCVIFISWHQAKHLLSTTMQSLSLTASFQCVSAVGVCTTILEGEIFRD